MCGVLFGAYLLLASWLTLPGGLGFKKWFLGLIHTRSRRLHRSACATYIHDVVKKLRSPMLLGMLLAKCGIVRSR